MRAAALRAAQEAAERDAGAVTPSADVPPARTTLLRVCSNCGAANNPSRRFCLKCGQPLPDPEAYAERECAICGTLNNPARRFCLRCGSSLPGL